MSDDRADIIKSIYAENQRCRAHYASVDNELRCQLTMGHGGEHYAAGCGIRFTDAHPRAVTAAPDADLHAEQQQREHVAELRASTEGAKS